VQSFYRGQGCLLEKDNTVFYRRQGRLYHRTGLSLVLLAPTVRLLEAATNDRPGKSLIARMSDEAPGSNALSKVRAYVQISRGRRGRAARHERESG
jgi:hypothetical protein